jgi:LmbE family N-acetylglucosaminyl deacetylase
VTAGTFQHIFVEPHFDDVALSCGGTVRALADAGARALVVTLFGGKPGEAVVVTAFAAGQHERWGAEADPIGVRIAEQEAALELLGVTTWERLHWLDAIYRGDQYLSDDDLFGPVKPDDAPLVEQIRDALSVVRQQNPGATWYVPLGVGNHVDHQIALAACRDFPGLRLYEDFPYAHRYPGSVAARAAELGARPADRVDISAQLDTKIAAIGRYVSQIPTLFGDADSMARAVREFAREGEVDLERFWVL